jgi:hypothetical protein
MEHKLLGIELKYWLRIKSIIDLKFNRDIEALISFLEYESLEIEKVNAEKMVLINKLNQIKNILDRKTIQ